MWWAGSKTFDVYLGTRALVACGAGEAPLVVKIDGFDAALEALRKWVATATTRRRVRLWLSGGLCRPFIVPAVEGLTNAAETANVAATLAPQHTGLQGKCIVFVERGSAASPTVAVAVRDDQLASIHACLETQTPKHRLVSIRPWWAEVLRYGLLREPGLTALGVQDCDSMTVLTGRESGAFETAGTYSPIVDRETARSVMTRAMLSVDAAPESELTSRLEIDEDGDRENTPGLALGALAVFSR